MFNYLKTDTFNWILITGVILFIIEITFFGGGMIISALFFGLFIYIGWKRFYKLWGKVFFWIGVIGLVFAIFNMMAIRFFVVVAILLFIINYSKSKKVPEYLSPHVSAEEPFQQEKIIKTKPLFEHKIFGNQETVDEAYQWRDINIHGAFGDRVIDLSNTVLPDETAVISIRHLVGNIEIYIPYEVEVSIHHSSVFGRTNIFGTYFQKLTNQSFLYKTEKYETVNPRVKIITSLLSGDIEVKRI
ncbi:cell wall-active antibiotics response protein LiaF [Virgibacillus flavescens]|uniref:cell wall-active antibiotics response protein LiaF n=1 Tax=Virgibacillus flavescens TaxID=1611422 RepID=UPI003D32A8C4